MTSSQHPMARLTGLVAAPHTPLSADGEVNLDAIERIAALHAAGGVRAAFVCGTTGEGISLTTEERRNVARRWCDVAGRDMKVFVQVGGNALPQCRELAAHAQEIGAAAIGAFAPSFYRPKTVEDLVDFCAAVADAAPALPFYYYHIPCMTGVDLSMPEFLARGGPRIATLAGLKFTDQDLWDFGRCVRIEGGRYNMLFGLDEMLLAGMVAGADGAVGSTYNFAAPLYQGILAAHRSGDLEAARAGQGRAEDLLALINRSGGTVAGKAVMKMVGVDCGPVRPPLRTLSDQQCHRLRAELEALGFFDYCSRLGPADEGGQT